MNSDNNNIAYKSLEKYKDSEGKEKTLKFLKYKL